MAHVLIDGESTILADVHEALRRWGMTVGRISSDARGRGFASRAECDVVLFLCDEEQDGSGSMDCHLKSLSPVEDRSTWRDESRAPLVVIGRGKLAEIMGRQAWRLIPGIGPGGDELKQALESCRKAPRPTGSPTADRSDRSDRDEQLHFLGHELRSPLTAIKTALEVMQGDLWGTDEAETRAEIPAADRSRLRMLEIALRNVRRMHHTVEWSQNLLQFEGARTEPEARPLSLSQLCVELGRMCGGEVRFQGPDRSEEHELDLVLLLAAEAIVAVRFGEAGVELAVTVDTEAAGAGRLRLEILRSAEQWRLANPDQAPDSLNPSATTDFPELYRHLQRFADFLNPSAPLGRAGGEIRICGDPRQGIGLAIECDLRVPESHRVTLAG